VGVCRVPQGLETESSQHMANDIDPDHATIEWSTRKGAGWTLVEFALPGPLDPSALRYIVLPAEVLSLTQNGLIISGRGPVWLFAYLVHLAHPFAWVATYEPRLRGGIVVESHLPTGPRVGEIVPIQEVG
jgi:CRISPR-associated protein Csx3